MATSRIFAVLAVILFAVGFILVAFTKGNADIIQDLLWLGLTSFAAAHAL